MIDDSSEPIMISALQHYSYRRRQRALIHVEQQFSSSVHTARGDAAHAQYADYNVLVDGNEMAVGAQLSPAEGVTLIRMG